MEKLRHCLKVTGQLKLAEEYYRQSVIREEMNPRAHVALADMFHEQNRGEEAEEHYLFLSRYWRKKCSIYERLASIYTNLHEIKKAEYIVNEVLPDLPEEE